MESGVAYPLSTLRSHISLATGDEYASPAPARRVCGPLEFSDGPGGLHVLDTGVRRNSSFGKPVSCVTHLRISSQKCMIATMHGVMNAFTRFIHCKKSIPLVSTERRGEGKRVAAGMGKPNSTQLVVISTPLQ